MKVPSGNHDGIDVQHFDARAGVVSDLKKDPRK